MQSKISCLALLEGIKLCMARTCVAELMKGLLHAVFFLIFHKLLNPSIAAYVFNFFEG